VLPSIDYITQKTTKKIEVLKKIKKIETIFFLIHNVRPFGGDGTMCIVAKVGIKNAKTSSILMM